MFNFIRKLDRLKNKFPELTYPNLFVLKSGYENFVKRFPDNCESLANDNKKYVRMKDRVVLNRDHLNFL